MKSPSVSAFGGISSQVIYSFDLDRFFSIAKLKEFSVHFESKSHVMCTC